MTGGRRVARTVAVAAAAVWLTAFAHVAAGGHTPDLLGLAVAVVLGYATATWLGRRARSLAATAVGLGALQAVLHAWFSLASSGCTATTTNGRAAVHGGVHGGAATAGVACDPAGHAMAGSPVTMLLAHGLAVLAVAAVLVVGERGLRDLVAVLSPLALLPRPVAALPVLARRRTRSPRRVDARGVREAVLSLLPQRAPPAGLPRTAPVAC